MILYLDTSALAKAYVEEDFSAEIKAVLEKASIAATHQITFVEFHAALARAFREGRIREEQQKIAMQEFVRDWPGFLKIEISDPLLARASRACEIFALRAYDGLHLAAAEFLLKKTGEPFLFAAFDRRLNSAADFLEMEILRGLGW